MTTLAFASSVLLLAQAVRPVLDPPTQAVLVMALLAFTLLGLALMVGASLAGRWVRRAGGDDLRRPMPLARRAVPEAYPLPRHKQPVALSGDTVDDHVGPNSTATRVG